MEKKFDVFGKIAYTNASRRINKVIVNVDLRTDRFGRPALGISASIRNATNTDIVCGGQCLDDIAQYKLEHNQELFDFLYSMWKKYHLNDMKVGTPEQEAAIEKWRESSSEQDYTKYDYTEVCKYLKSIGLYEVEYHGLEFDGMYKYGHSWLYKEIEPEDLEKIKALFE